MTDREAILQALFTLLQTITDVTVLRNENVPEKDTEWRFDYLARW
jgi:hypothetical protein